MSIFYEHLILVPGIAFILSVILKWFYSVVKNWRFDLSIALWSGGMPSAHTAVSVSLATAMVLKEWLWSDEFAIVMAFTALIIYDAVNIRFEAWLHASAINKYIWEKRFRESLWHLPSEAFAWSVLGIFVAIVLYYL